MNEAMKRQQAKMKSAWNAVKRQGLKGAAARDAVAKLLSGKAPKVSLTPHAPKKRGGARPGAGRPKGRKDSKPRKRRGSPRDRTVQLPFSMGAVDIASGAYRDPGQNVQRTFTSVADLAGLSARIATSQVGIHPSFRDPWQVRLYLSAGVM